MSRQGLTHRLLQVCLLVAVVLAAPALMARTFIAFGPQPFTRSTAAPQEATAAFDVRNPSTSYTLEINDSTVSSAVVTLNGAQLFGPNDFNQKTTQLSRPVTLAAHNTLTVELRGSPESGFTIRVVGVDDDPPTIAATAAPPPNAAGWNRSDVTVTFTCDDATSGVATCPAARVVSAEGTSAVSGTATDVAGNAATTSVTVRLDKTPPAIAVTSPAANATVSAASVTITGTATDAGSGIASLSCNGVPAVLAQGTFTCAVTLAPGPNTIQLAAVDVAGNASSSSLPLRLSTAPTVQLVEPRNFSFLNLSPVTVRGTVSDSNVALKVNGVAAPVSNGAFSVVVPLVEGNNTLTAVATTPGGAVGTTSVQVTLDTTPPRVTIQSPPDGFATTDATVSVSGIVNDVVVGTVNDQEAQVTVNGVTASVANRSFVASSVPLAIGDNTIQAVGRDRVGNAFTASIHVRRDAAAGARISAVSGNGQTAPIATQLAVPIVARVTNALGAPVAGQSVVFRVVQNDGALSDGNSAPKASLVATTAADGTARAIWIAGSRSGAGNNRVEATATGFSGTALFLASSTPAAPAALYLDSGADQSGATGEALYYPFVVVVTDGGHNRRAGVPVTFQVTAGGGKLDGQTAVTVNTDGDGRALARLTLGPEAGYDNNTVEASIGGGARPVIFSASAKAAGNAADTKVAGVVVDNSNAPVAGVTMRLYQAYQANNSNIPIPIGTPVITDANGQFVMNGAPVGSFKLVADGTTVSTAAYPSVEYDITTVAGQTNTVNSPIYLPVLDTVNRLCVSPTVGGTLTLPASPGFSLTVAPGSATFPGGSRTGCITVTPVHGDKVPMVPGFGQQPRFVVTIQPVGTHFNPPAQISIPNVDGLRAREVTEMYSYDHDLSAFVAIGTGTVTADGSRIVSDPGVGVMKAGWHCGGNPNASGTAATCPECQKCANGGCVADTSKDGRQCDQHECKICRSGDCFGITEARVAFDLTKVKLRKVSPSQPLGPDDWGRVDAEKVEIVIDAICDDQYWTSVLTDVTGAYARQERLLPGVAEVRNTDANNFCDQAKDLSTISVDPGKRWYMIDAISAHEEVHFKHLKPILLQQLPDIEQRFNGFRIPLSAAKTRQQAVAKIRNLDAYKDAENFTTSEWRRVFAEEGKRDHMGPTDRAEHAVTDPVIATICQMAKDNNWGPCKYCP